MARRSFQEGCVFKRGRRKKVWVGRWSEYVVDEDGGDRRVLKSEVLGPVSELSRGDAKERLRERLRRDGNGRKQRPADVTFQVFIETWWKPAVFPTYKESTREQCELALKNHLIPHFGRHKLREITKADVQVFVGKLLETLAPDTVRTIRRYLGKIISTAVEWLYVDQNVTQGIRLPAPRRREPPFLTPEQFQKLLAGLPEKVRVMILLVMMTSMRVCEILALRWRRVDLRTGTLRISERFYRGDFSSVKTKKSDRDLPLGSVALETLKNWRLKHKGGPDDLVFASRTGRPMSDGNLRRRVIYPTCDRLRVPRVSWHGFRHLHSSLLAYLGIPVSVAQAQLGHADPRITLEIYTHMASGAQREAVEKLERFLLFPICSQIGEKPGTQTVN